MLDNEELLTITGGAFKLKLISIVGGFVVFLIGVVDGIINPKKCN